MKTRCSFYGCARTPAKRTDGYCVTHTVTTLLEFACRATDENEALRAALTEANAEHCYLCDWVRERLAIGYERGPTTTTKENG